MLGAKTVEAGSASSSAAASAARVASAASPPASSRMAAPAAASVSLVCDSGLNAVANSDKVSHTGALAVQTAETAGLIEYSTDGLNWASTLAAAEGVNNIKVRVTDAAGNLGATTLCTTATALEELLAAGHQPQPEALSAFETALVQVLNTAKVQSQPRLVAGEQAPFDSEAT